MQATEPSRNPSAPPPASPSTLTTRSFAIKAAVAAWALLALFLLTLYFRADWLDMLFSLFISFALILFLFHEILQREAGFFWTLGAFGLAGILPLLYWNDLDKADIISLMLQWGLGFVVLRSAELFFIRLDKRLEAVRGESEQSAQRTKTLIQENQYYAARIPELKSSIGSKQQLSSFAHEMGTLLDPEKIKEKLLTKIHEIFPQDEVLLQTSGTQDDAAGRWIIEKKVPMLVKDTATDKRLLRDAAHAESDSSAGIKGPGPGQGSGRSEGARSIAALPLIIERAVTGILRVQSGVPDRFTKSDLQQLELYAHQAVLALENAQLFAKMNALATKDGLTGLATHRAFQERISEEILRAARYHKNLALVMVDIDHFKSVNDQYGHLAGDAVLREVAQILAGSCREIDFAARYGGEEFCLVFPEMTMDAAAAKAEEIRRQIETRAIRAGQSVLRVTASFGCAAFPDDAQSANQLVRSADQRLYRSKSEGRNRVTSHG